MGESPGDITVLIQLPGCKQNSVRFRIVVKRRQWPEGYPMLNELIPPNPSPNLNPDPIPNPNPNPNHHRNCTLWSSGVRTDCSPGWRGFDSRGGTFQ